MKMHLLREYLLYSLCTIKFILFLMNYFQVSLFVPANISNIILTNIAAVAAVANDTRYSKLDGTNKGLVL